MLTDGAAPNPGSGRDSTGCVCVQQGVVEQTRFTSTEERLTGRATPGPSERL